MRHYITSLCAYLQVPLGVIDENETSYEGMTKILEELQKYVPSKLVDIEESIPGTDLTQEKAFVDTLVGGDLLSAVRARGAIYIRSGSELLEHRLRGFRVVSEDWHALVCYLEVSVHSVDLMMTIMGEQTIDPS